MTYCWKCPKCGQTGETNMRTMPVKCAQGHLMARDYQAEAAGLSLENLRKAHE